MSNNSEITGSQNAKDKRISLRLQKPSIKKKYEALAQESPLTLNNLAEMALELAYNEVARRVEAMKGFQISQRM